MTAAAASKSGIGSPLYRIFVNIVGAPAVRMIARRARAGMGTVHSSPEIGGNSLFRTVQGLKIINQKMTTTPANAGQPSANHRR